MRIKINIYKTFFKIKSKDIENWSTKMIRGEKYGEKPRENPSFQVKS